MDLSAPIVAGVEALRTPALIIDLDAVDHNVSVTLRMLHGDADRWRPHLKTAKLALTMRRMRAAGVVRAKCATSLELETACAEGFTDVLLAYPAQGPHAATVRDIAARYPATVVSALVEHPDMLAAWRGSSVGLYIDLDSGMARTGMPMDPAENVLALARAIGQAGLRFAGLHCYDGHAYTFAPEHRAQQVTEGYDRLFALADSLARAGCPVPEVITAGTPAFPGALHYPRFSTAGIPHRLSPGTVVYNDARSLTQLPPEAGYRPAVFVLSRVISHPSATRFCCDAGHKSVSADSGDPTCEVLSHPGFVPQHPSEEHLPVDIPPGATLPPRGSLLWLLPGHVCPTVNNFDHAVIVAGGAIQGLERVTARGRHPPLEPAAEI